MDNREQALQLLRELNEMRLELPLEYMALNYELADLISIKQLEKAYIRIGNR